MGGGAFVGRWRVRMTRLRVRRPVGAVLSVRMPSDLAVRIDEEATRRGVRLSDVVREAIEAYLAPTVTTSDAVTLSVSYS